MCLNLHRKTSPAFNKNKNYTHTASQNSHCHPNDQSLGLETGTEIITLPNISAWTSGTSKYSHVLWPPFIKQIIGFDNELFVGPQNQLPEVVQILVQDGEIWNVHRKCKVQWFKRTPHTVPTSAWSHATSYLAWLSPPDEADLWSVGAFSVVNNVNTLTIKSRGFTRCNDEKQTN